MAKKNDSKEQKPSQKIDKEQDELEPQDIEPEDDEDEIDNDESDEDEIDEDDESDEDGEDDEDDSDDRDNRDSKKNRETPEQKRARLKRQLERQERKMGIKSDGDKKPEVKKKPRAENSLSQADLIAIVRADVHDDDVDEVADYARFKRITVKEALKSNVVKTLLKERAEERETAEATSTSSSRRSNSRPSNDQLLDNARKGNMPDDKSDIRALIKARKGIKK